MGGEPESVAWREIVYNPLPSQRAFHESGARFKGFSGPIGSGKSQALCHEAIKLSYMNAGRMGLVGAPTYPMLRDATQTALFETLEANRLRFDHNKSENLVSMRDTGSKILLRAVEEFDRLRGTNLAWFGLDELTYGPEAAWLRLEGRLRDPKAARLCGFGVWTPNGFDWVHKRFLAVGQTNYHTIRARPFENIHLLEQVPDYYERLKNSYDERLYRQEVMGEYLSLEGKRVYNSFSRTDHVADLTPSVSRPLLWALDFNVDPMSSVVAQIHDGVLEVLDEIVLHEARTDDACRVFLARYGRHPRGVQIFGDASGHQRQTTGNTDYTMIRDYFREHSSMKVEFLPMHANPHVRDRVNAVNARLKSVTGKIGLKVDSKCTELIADFKEVLYKKETCEIDKDRDRMRTHLSDALGYLVWNQCRSNAANFGEQNHRLIV